MINNIQEMIEEAKKLADQNQETPIRQLTRKIINEEREYLYSDQQASQRKKKIKNLVVV